MDGSIRAQERGQQNASFSPPGGISPLAERESFAGWLADNLGMEWNQAQAAMSAFNRLPDDVRRTFVELLSSPDPPARGGRPLTAEQSRHVRQALATLMRATSPLDAALADTAADDSSERANAHEALVDRQGGPQ